MKQKLTKLSFLELISTSFMLFARNTVYNLAVIVICYGPLCILILFMFFLNDKYENPDSFGKVLLCLFVFLIGHSLAAGMMCYFGWFTYLGEKINILHCLKRVFSHTVWLTVMSINFFLLIFVCIIVPTIIFVILGIASHTQNSLAYFIGTLCGILLLITLACATWIIALPVSLVEETGLAETAKRCSDLISGSFSKNCGVSFIIIGLLFLYSLLFTILYFIFSFHELRTDTQNIFILVVTGLSIPLFTSLFSMLSTVVYGNLRVVKEGFDVERMAGQFGEQQYKLDSVKTSEDLKN